MLHYGVRVEINKYVNFGHKKTALREQSCLKCYLYVSSSLAMNAPSHVPNPNITTQARY